MTEAELHPYVGKAVRLTLADGRIIAGTLIAPLPVAAGDRVAVSFGPLGSLDVAFSGAGRVPPD